MLRFCQWIYSWTPFAGNFFPQKTEEDGCKNVLPDLQSVRLDVVEQCECEKCSSVPLSRGVCINTAPGKFFQSKYGRIHYLLKGNPEDPLIVFSHGVSLFSFVWNRMADLLVNCGYQVLLYDFFGHGYSASPDVKYTVDLFVHQLEELLEGLHLIKGPDSLILIGHSMGGLVSSEYTARHKDQVKKLILMNVAGVPTKPTLTNLLVSFFHFGVTITKRSNLVDRGIQSLGRFLKHLANCYGPSYEELTKITCSLEEEYEKMEEAVQKKSKQVLQKIKEIGSVTQALRFFRSLKFLFNTWLYQLSIDGDKTKVVLSILRDCPLIDGDNSHIFLRISNHTNIKLLKYQPENIVPKKIPVLIIWGEDDGVTPINLLEELKQYLPESQIFTLPDTDHSIFLQQPIKIFHKIREFLQQ